MLDPKSGPAELLPGLNGSCWAQQKQPNAKGMLLLGLIPGPAMNAGLDARQFGCCPGVLCVFFFNHYQHKYMWHAFLHLLVLNRLPCQRLFKKSYACETFLFSEIQVQIPVWPIGGTQ